MKRVLVVDDEEDMLWMLQRNLNKGMTNVEILSAKSGEEALAVLSDKQTGLRPALAKVLPKSRHQWCQAHYLRNLAEPLADTDALFKAELRKTVRQHVGDYVTITRETVSIDGERVWLDAGELERELAMLHEPGQPIPAAAVDSAAQAIELYQGAFLQGFPVGDSQGFEDWVSLERERLHRLVLGALQKLAAWHLENGRYASGIPHAARALQLDPYLEDVQRQMMRLLAYDGQRFAVDLR